MLNVIPQKLPPLHSITVMGIDPGLTVTGWGVVRQTGDSMKSVAYGTLRPPPKLSMAQRLNFLYQEIKILLQAHVPHKAVVEKIFLNANPASTLTLGLARGVLLMTPASLNIEVVEYPSTVIKKAVTGYGHASKTQILHMVMKILNLPDAPPTDAADALAMALCCLYHKPLLS